MELTGHVGLLPTSPVTSPVSLGDGLSGVAATHIGDLDAQQVARMTAASYYWASPGWLAAAERLPGHHFLHLAVKDASDRIVGLLPCQYVTDSSTPSFYDIPRMIAEGAVFGCADWLSAAEQGELTQAQAQLTTRDLYPSLVAASPNSCCPIAFEPSLTPGERQVVSRALLRLFTLWAADLNVVTAGALFLYPESGPELYGPLAEAFDAAGYQHVTLGGDCVLPIQRPDFDGYLARFRSSRRVAIRRERRDFAEGGFHVKITRGAHALTDDMVGLQVSLQRKYGATQVDVAALQETFAELRRSLGDEMVVFTAERGDTTIGYIAFCEYGDALYARVTGFDHQVLAAHDFCYFNLVYYEPLSWAAARGLTRIHYGFATYEAKLRRGCELRRAHGYVAVAGDLASPARTAAQILSLSEQRRLDYVETTYGGGTAGQPGPATATAQPAPR
ncbi:MAG TPA: GNAT family N-acetyltransferase [Streptosporangiaceae bacterium]|nr:GNAT family N-acetyltransferase [Streptosporangiaceae bacterium]